MKRITVFLITLILLSFFIRLFFAFVSPVKYWDETIYVNLARNLVTYHEYSFFHGFADFSPNWPLASFRPPLLPIIITFVSLLTFNQFFLNLIIPFFGSLGVIGIFLLSEKLFNQKVAIYSSVLFALFPLNIFWGSKILTDSLFLTLIIFSIYFFWLCFFEKTKRYEYAILFGIFSSLSFLSRYAFIWFFPLFFLFLLIKYKNLKFLLEKRLLVSIIVFFIIVGPWFIYNYFLYGSWLGFLIQANQASLRWGGTSTFFYFISLLKNFIFFVPFIILGILNNEKYKENSKLFIILWFLIIFFSASLMGHKEDRYLLPILPSLCILSSLGISKFKKYRNFIIALIFIGLLVANIFLFNSVYSTFNSEEQKCLFNSMDFLKKSSVSYVVTEHFSPVYFYTLKPNIRVNNYTETMNLIEENYPDETIYYFYIDGDWFNLILENKSLKDNLVYSCNKIKIFNLVS